MASFSANTPTGIPSQMKKRRGAVRRKAEAKVTGCGSVRTDKEQSARSWLYLQHCAATWDEDSTSLESEAWFQNDKKGRENGNSAFSEQGKNTNFQICPCSATFHAAFVFPIFPGLSHISDVLLPFLQCNSNIPSMFPLCSFILFCFLVFS